MLFPLALPQADRTADEIGATATSDTDAESSGSDPRMQTRSGHARVVGRSSSDSEDDMRYTDVPEVEVVRDDSDNDIQPMNAPVVPSAEEFSSDNEIPEQENDVPQLRRSTRNEQLPGRFRESMYAMYPQTVSTSQWKEKFDALWSNFPERRQKIYDNLLWDVNRTQS